MKINTNKWNKFRYTLYTPWYDLLGRYFRDPREKSVASLEIKPGDKVLIIGSGTGLDLEFIPAFCEIYVTDITPSMIGKVIKRNKILKLNVQAMVMDGQALEFPDNSFDKIILHLILAVIPDPIKCIRESERVLKQGGQIAVFDKFVPKDRKVSITRRFVNVFANFFFTDVTRSFESIDGETGLTVIQDLDAGFNGNFRRLRLVQRPLVTK